MVGEANGLSTISAHGRALKRLAPYELDVQHDSLSTISAHGRALKPP